MNCVAIEVRWFIIAFVIFSVTEKFFTRSFVLLKRIIWKKFGKEKNKYKINSYLYLFSYVTYYKFVAQSFNVRRPFNNRLWCIGMHIYIFPYKNIFYFLSMKGWNAIVKKLSSSYNLYNGCLWSLWTLLTLSST